MARMTIAMNQAYLSEEEVTATNEEFVTVSAEMTWLESST